MGHWRAPKIGDRMVQGIRDIDDSWSWMIMEVRECDWPGCTEVAGANAHWFPTEETYASREEAEAAIGQGRVAT